MKNRKPLLIILSIQARIPMIDTALFCITFKFDCISDAHKKLSHCAPHADADDE